MADDLVNIEIDGVPLKVRKGEMLIRATDAHGAYVPRFCYHEKLSIAANCRMCLVEVEKAPKPLPACATPVVEGMKVFTKSARAIGAQRATMEFLLINHPLDCPICDQGGECELQDLAVGFGRDISRYHEGKRVVPDVNLGPLIATDMTRCIHCTRCIRFTEEIAGIQELGMIGRGEHMKVRTYVESTVNHELAGNVIDLCPVGALVSKPYRFSARAWEMSSTPLISPHDPVGTNLFGHVLRGKLMRVVPRENEAINETWIADRDRFSYEGVYSPDRLATPLLRRGDTWVGTDWESALAQVAQGLRARAADLGVLVSSSSTLEELYLAGRIARGLKSHNVDHRLRQRDFRDQQADPVFPGLGMRIAEVDSLNALLVIGANLRREVPILAHRVRKAAVRGAQVAMLNPARIVRPRRCCSAGRSVRSGSALWRRVMRPSQTCAHSPRRWRRSPGRLWAGWPKAATPPAPISPERSRIVRRASKRWRKRASARATCWRIPCGPMCCSAVWNPRWMRSLPRACAPSPGLNSWSR